LVVVGRFVNWIKTHHLLFVIQIPLRHLFLSTP
jgi:hypothetical protein